MQVKQRLRINSAVTAASMLAMIIVLAITAIKVNGALEASNLADSILTVSYERLLLRTDNLRTNSERSKSQLIAKHRQVMELLQRAKEIFRSPQDRKIVAELTTLNETIGKLVRTIRENREKRRAAPNPAPLLLEMEDRLTNQLNMRIYEAILLDSKLQDSSNTALVSASRSGGIWIALVILTAGSVTLFNSARMSRTITGRINRLREGAAKIGSGELGHRIDIRSGDEFAELADSFNEMTAKLGDSYQNLERENKERRDAEEKLRKSAAELEAANTELGDSRRAAINLLEDALDARRQAEEAAAAIQKSEGRFRAFMTATSDVIYSMSPDWSEMRHLDGKEFIANTRDPSLEWLIKYIHADDQAHVLATIHEAIRTRSIFELEHRVIQVDGTLGWTFSRAVPLFDATGEIVEWFGAARDITEQKLAEEALRESETRYRRLMQSIQVPLGVVNKSGESIFFNDRFTRIFGYTLADLPTIEAWWQRAYPDAENRRRVVENWRAKMERSEQTSTESEPEELNVTCKDGSVRVVVISNLIIEDMYLATFVDITERKQAEERLQASLHEKEVMLKEIHHRVKNNLQVISSLVGLQAEGLQDETVREVLREVTWRVRSMALVHEKLYQSADLACIDFAEYARSLLNYLWRANGSVAATVRLVFDLEPVSLPVDTAVPCGLILNELAGNALKHAFKGRSEGEVTVSLHGTPEGYASLCVCDNGVGLPAGLDWRETRSLGLRLVQMLAGQLKAEVAISASEGTKFEVTFLLPEEKIEQHLPTPI